jgi:hypothetical protein
MLDMIHYPNIAAMISVEKLVDHGREGIVYVISYAVHETIG